MARPIRIVYEGALYHVTSRGNERKRIFQNSDDRRKFLSIINEAYQRYGIFLHCFVLMDNHYHMMIETPKGNLIQAMHYINGKYTLFYNWRHKRTGHLFQGRYKGILVEKDEYLLELSRYIHLNPVRTGEVANPANYVWSSFVYYMDSSKTSPDWLRKTFILGQFSHKDNQARSRYAGFVKEGIRKSPQNPLSKTYAQAILGSERFRIQVKERLGKPRIQPEVPSTRKLAEDSWLTPEEVIKLVAGYFGAQKDVMVLKGKKANLARTAAIYLCRKYTPASLLSLSSHFGNIVYSSITQVSRRMENKRKVDRYLDRKIRAVEKVLENKRLQRVS